MAMGAGAGRGVGSGASGWEGKTHVVDPAQPLLVQGVRVGLVQQCTRRFHPPVRGAGGRGRAGVRCVGGGGRRGLLERA
jgi:hypothetical protein